MAGNSRVRAVYAALRRFEADLSSGLITQDGCPMTASAMANARKIAKNADQYGLGKPSQVQKIDPAVTAVLAHEAASDARAAGWPEKKTAYAYFA
jgi:phage terminase large subunit-like protein